MEKSNIVDSKFRLAILAAKRAKQLLGGARKKVESESDNPLTIALKELKMGKLRFTVFPVEDEVLEYNESIPIVASAPLILSSDTALDRSDDEDSEDEEELDFHLDDI